MFTWHDTAFDDYCGSLRGVRAGTSVLDREEPAAGWLTETVRAAVGLPPRRSAARHEARQHR